MSLNVTICSAFRNASHYVDYYFSQIEELSDILRKRGDWPTFILGYGDSRDGTTEKLFEYGNRRANILLVDCSHGGKEYGSIVHAQRFRQLAYVANRIWEKLPHQVDVALWLESDLIWETEVLIKLIDHTALYPVIAPLVFHKDPITKFYDTFAFRKYGVNFTNEPPYHKKLHGGINEMDSVGSCVAFSGHFAKELTIPVEDVIVGMCRQARALGHGIYCDADLKVYHP